MLPDNKGDWFQPNKFLELLENEGPTVLLGRTHFSLETCLNTEQVNALNNLLSVTLRRNLSASLAAAVVFAKIENDIKINI